MAPLFSVLVPVHNRQECIGATIDSVLDQTFPDYELIVIDDGSTDETRKTLDSYGDRIRVIHEEQQGPEVARNRAASQARGEYLALLDSDDLFLPGALMTYARVVRALDRPALIIGAMAWFNDGEALPAQAQPDQALRVLKFADYLSKDVGVGLSSSRIVIRKSVFESAGGLRNSTPTTFHADDVNLMLRAGTSGPCIVVLNPTTVAYRNHTGNSIKNTGAMVRGVCSLVASEREGEYPGGVRRLLARYAVIGGPAQLWLRIALARGRYDLALQLLRKGWPMMMVSALRKAANRLRKRSQPILVPAQ